MIHFMTYAFGLALAAVGLVQLSRSNKTRPVFAVLVLSYALTTSAAYFGQRPSTQFPTVQPAPTQEPAVLQADAITSSKY